jgi:hypothetical protein
MNRSHFAPVAAVAAVAVLAAVASCSGSSGPSIPTQAVISIDLELIDGGTIMLPAAFTGTVQNESMQILNGGRATLTVNGVKVALADGGTPPGNFAFSQPSVTVDGGSNSLPVQIGGIGSLLGGEQPSAFVEFAYSPSKAGRTDATLVVDSDAPARGHLVVGFSACAVALDAGLQADGGC